jgi:hypothetical protein
MNDSRPTEDSQTRFTELAGQYQPKLPRKFNLLLPFKTQIEELLARHASYDDIRLLLQDVKIIVSKDTVHRFCRQVIGQKPIRIRHPQGQTDTPAPKILPVEIQPTPETIQTTLRGQRERFTGPWSRRKRGPRIADSKNL